MGAGTAVSVCNSRVDILATKVDAGFRFPHATQVLQVRRTVTQVEVAPPPRPALRNRATSHPLTRNYTTLQGRWMVTVSKATDRLTLLAATESG